MIIHETVLGSMIWAHVSVHWREPPWMETWDLYYRPVLIAVAIVSGALLFAGHYWVPGFLHSTYAALFAWMWWNDNQKRRKKLRDRLAARVKEMAGRLVVVHPVAEER